MSDLPQLLINWPSIVTILVVLFVAALVGPGRRPPVVSSPPNSPPMLDLSLWPASGGHMPGFRHYPGLGARPDPEDRWAGYYEQQFAPLQRRLRN